jgi:hypothetical protein
VATAPFEYACNVAGAFETEPPQGLIGYLTAFYGFGLPAPLKADLTVTQPVTEGTAIEHPAPGKAIPVVGVLDSFYWGGEPGDPLQFVFHVSHENANQLWSVLQAPLTNNTVRTLGWWIGDYDQEIKVWYDKSSPMSPSAISGTIQGGDNPNLNVDLTGTAVKGGALVYKATIQVAPAANQQYTLHFANSASTPIAKAWGLQVGPLAATDIPPAT